MALERAVAVGGAVEAFTSNLLAQIETPEYWRFRQEGPVVVRQVLDRYGIEF